MSLSNPVKTNFLRSLLNSFPLLFHFSFFLFSIHSILAISFVLCSHLIPTILFNSLSHLFPLFFFSSIYFFGYIFISMTSSSFFSFCSSLESIYPTLFFHLYNTFSPSSNNSIPPSSLSRLSSASIYPFGANTSPAGGGPLIIPAKTAAPYGGLSGQGHFGPCSLRGHGKGPLILLL